MGRIVVTEFMSLDGVIEDPGGAEDFKYGGWSFEFDRGDEGNQFKLDETMGSDGAAARPRDVRGLRRRRGRSATASSPTSSTRCRSTSSPRPSKDPEWTNTTVLDGDVGGGGRASCATSIDGDIVVHGSARLVQTLLENDLVDQLHLMVFPVVLGAGKRAVRRDERRRSRSSSSSSRPSATA